MMRGEIILEQGDLIFLENERLCLVVSHDCDIAHDSETLMEIIELEHIPEVHGIFAKAKHVRELHLQHENQSLKLIASSKETIKKQNLLAVKPNSKLNASNIRTLQKWLSCRYKRHSIPEALNCVIRPVFEESAKKIKDTNDSVDGVYIMFDEVDSEKNIYELSIKVVYDSQKEGGIKKATDLSQKILTKLQKTEQVIHSCEAISDEEFTFAEIKSFMEYRLDFLCD